MPHRPQIALLPLVLALAACAGEDMRSYPALSPRAVETRFNAPPAAVAPPETVAATPADARGLASLRAEVAASAAAFNAAQPASERAVAAAVGTAAGSEAWVSAMQAIAALDVIRARTGDAVTRLGEIGSGLAEQAAAGAPSSLDADAALDAGAAEEKRQAAAIAALSGKIRAD